MKAIHWILAALFILVAVMVVPWVVMIIGFTQYETDWTGIQEEAGPLPLTSAQGHTIRLVDQRQAMGGETKRLYWDEGKGPVLARDRIKPLVDSIPIELYSRVTSTRDVPANLYAPFRDRKGTMDEPIYNVWCMVVSLNPDVLVMSVHERPVRPPFTLPLGWDMSSADDARRAHLAKRIEYIGGVTFRTYAGTIVPWSEEMHVISTDPKVEFQRLKFDNGQATIFLEQGKLMLRRNGTDVDVTRE